MSIKKDEVTYDLEAEKKDPNLAFKRIVKNVVATLNQKDTRLDYNQRGIFYTQHSEMRSKST